VKKEEISPSKEVIDMRTLSENQISVLKLHRAGMPAAEICKTTGLSRSSVDEAIERGPANISRAIEILRIASENSILDRSEIQNLRKILDNC
jgi:transcriptional regulator